MYVKQNVMCYHPVVPQIFAPDINRFVIECQLFKCSNDPIFKCSNLPMFFSFHRFARISCPLVRWSIGPLDYWSIGPLVECQMLNVNKVKLLSERTSGVPPVIFILSVMCQQCNNRGSHFKEVNFGKYVALVLRRDGSVVQRNIIVEKRTI